MKDSGFTVDGIVQDAVHSMFKVKIDESDAIVTCTLSGKCRQNNIKILRGDKVTVEISVDDVTRGRIIWRYA